MWGGRCGRQAWRGDDVLGDGNAAGFGEGADDAPDKAENEEGMPDGQLGSQQLEGKQKIPAEDTQNSNNNQYDVKSCTEALRLWIWNSCIEKKKKAVIGPAYLYDYTVKMNNLLRLEQIH